jgi:DNA modification methylase
MKPYFESNGTRIFHGDCREVLRNLPDESVNCCVTSPPYWGLRDYGVEGQMGLESTPDEYVTQMVSVFREVKRVLRDDGTLWLNMGDCYNQGNKGQSGEMNPSYKQASNVGSLGTRRGPMLGSNRNRNHEGMKPKDLVGMPWLLAFALRADGWYLRQDIIWSKANPMPESVTDRCTKAHEYIFLLSKKERYYYNQEAISEPCAFGDRGSSFISEQDVLTKPNLGNGKRTIKVPGGWDRGNGAHGTIHQEL